jgi:peptide/nickel transport system permease protein
MPIDIVILWTDALIYLLLIVVIIGLLWARRQAHLRVPLQRLQQHRFGQIAMLILLVFISIGIMDSLHFRSAQSTQVKSILDLVLAPVGESFENTYSAPFAKQLYVKQLVTENGGSVKQTYPRLRYAATHLSASQSQMWDIIKTLSLAAAKATLLFALLFLLLRGRISLSFAMALWLIGWIVFALYDLSRDYHILGTDKIGQDVFYQAVKSIRTGLVIGTLTTLVMLPFAIMLGIMAGYFGKRTDDIIQYIYTTLNSIPGILLIAAAVLALQVYIAGHEHLFPSLEARADIRLLALCIILGITSWTSLCRLLRGEALKLREVDYVQAARVLGTSHLGIMLRHILPNVIHIVIIAVVLDFSGLVLAEAVLSYVGVGVDPTTFSWGNMINAARLELAREPIVWWPFLAAFIFMFTLVLSANIFSDAVRDAFDPRITMEK